MCFISDLSKLSGTIILGSVVSTICCFSLGLHHHSKLPVLVLGDWLILLWYWMCLGSVLGNKEKSEHICTQKLCLNIIKTKKILTMAGNIILLSLYQICIYVYFISLLLCDWTLVVSTVNCCYLGCFECGCSFLAILTLTLQQHKYQKPVKKKTP